MCGIVGTVNYKENPGGDIKLMVDFIKHRGPDAQKTIELDRIKFGHARLRVMDLDPKADQPFFNNNESIVVVFNGEIYNF
jgi:asparagine synthase (glutamine-hydrolysing)